MANTNLNPTDINATVADGTATGGTSPSPNATFKERVEAMITYSLDTTTTPTLLQLNHFIQDAVKDITFKWIAIKPQDAYLFQRVTTAQSGTYSVGTSQIISVLRDHTEVIEFKGRTTEAFIGNISTPDKSFIIRAF